MSFSQKATITVFQHRSCSLKVAEVSSGRHVLKILAISIQRPTLKSVPLRTVYPCNISFLSAVSPNRTTSFQRQILTRAVSFQLLIITTAVSSQRKRSKFPFSGKPNIVSFTRSVPTTSFLASFPITGSI